MAIGTNSKYNRLGIRSEVRSTYIDDVVQNVKNDLNTLEQEIADAAIGTTNAETTAARPYQTDLKSRLDVIGSGQASLIDGFLVSPQGSPNMTVQVATGQGTINGIEVEKTSTTNTGTITAPTTNNRYDVVYINNTNTIGVATGSESADPVYPNIATTQKALATILLTPSTTTITATEVTDCRSWGAYYFHDGAYKYEWKAQDAIDDLDTTIGGEIRLIGDFYENIDISGLNNIVLQAHEANVYRISDTNSCFKSVNTITNETTGNKIYGMSCFGNSKAGSLPLYEIDFTDEFIISDCSGDGNASSSATGKDIEIDNCDDFVLRAVDLDSNSITNVTGDFSMVGGNFEMTGDVAIGGDIVITGNTTTAQINTTAMYHGRLHVNAATSENTIFDALDSYIPNNGDAMIISGAGDDSGNLRIFSSAQRVTSTRIDLYANTSSTAFILTVNDGTGTTVIDTISISW